MKTITRLVEQAAANRRRKLQDVDRSKGIQAAIDYLTKKGRITNMGKRQTLFGTTI